MTGMHIGESKENGTSITVNGPLRTDPENIIPA